ncbi:hypothetical protein [Paenibacillus thiaminolyticus]|uniref:hypothetical protein n=1 Tax=Paenibacillus thiaminolyticus TaxID=49283 RepID=UPI001F0EDC70|nr:hypothetical protein [Paenibacillus thiaminolyticus]
MGEAEGRRSGRWTRTAMNGITAANTRAAARLAGVPACRQPLPLAELRACRQPLRPGRMTKRAS